MCSPVIPVQHTRLESFLDIISRWHLKYTTFKHCPILSYEIDEDDMLTFCWDPSGQVQVWGGLQSPQGPLRPLPPRRPCLRINHLICRFRNIGSDPSNDDYLDGQLKIQPSVFNIYVSFATLIYDQNEHDWRY